MNDQNILLHFSFWSHTFFRSLISLFLLFLLPVLICPSITHAKSKDLENEKDTVMAKRDTLERNNGELPLSENKNGLSRPRFETIHLQFGIGGTVANFSDLDRLGVDKSNVSVPLSLYTYIPFQRNRPGFFLLSGADVNLLDANNFAFKMLLLYQTRPGILFGLGAARTSYVYGEAVNIEADQTQGLLALGINLSPRRVDLLLTLPLASSLETRFEQNNYSIRPAGVQVSLLFSLR